MKTSELYLHRKGYPNEDDLESNARGVMKSFFEDYEVGMCHELLWTMMKSVFIGEEYMLTSVERADLVSYYERLHELIHAGNTLYRELQVDK